MRVEPVGCGGRGSSESPSGLGTGPGGEKVLTFGAFMIDRKIRVQTSLGGVMFDLLLDIFLKTMVGYLDGNVYGQANKVCNKSQFWEAIWRKL